jgi:hypothetical protein
MDKVIRNLPQKIKVTVVAIGAIVLMGLSYIDHSYLWSVARLERISMAKGVADLITPGIVFRQDFLYKFVFWISVALTVGTAAALLYLSRRGHRRGQVLHSSTPGQVLHSSAR